MFVLLGAGFYQYLTGTFVPVDAPLPPSAGSATLGTFLLLTAFANGCTAMTGVEAISNGVPAFKKPESKNAATTLVWMAIIAITMFIGTTVLAHAFRVMPTAAESGVSQLARAIFGGARPATTRCRLPRRDPGSGCQHAYADFPRLSSIVARDGYLPRQFMNQGESSRVLERDHRPVDLRGDPDRGVQGRHAVAAAALHDWCVRCRSRSRRRHGHPLADVKTPGWKTSAAINGFGALVTGIVLVIVAVTKTLEGAWIVLILIPRSSCSSRRRENITTTSRRN